MTLDYIHGYSDEEQLRLIQQAEYWREELILREINYLPGESLLEIGCGVGAVLGILGRAFPGLQLAGIDLQDKQINFANQYLNNLGLNNVDLQVGDASKLPWQDNHFDRIYAIWFIEHLSNPQQVLREAKRVLKPGGTITLTETDYRTILVSPESHDYRYLQNYLCELMLQSQGNPYIGQSLGTLLNTAGFKQVKNKPIAFHYSSSLNNQQLKKFIDYIDSWLAPTLPQMIDKLGKNAKRLDAGLDWFNNIPYLANGAASITIYRASGINF